MLKSTSLQIPTMPGNEIDPLSGRSEDWEREGDRLEQLKSERDKWKEIAESDNKKRKWMTNKHKKLEERRDLATVFRSYSRSLLAVGALGLFVASVLLPLLLLDVPNPYSSLIPLFASAFAIIISMYVIWTRFQMGKIRSSEE